MLKQKFSKIAFLKIFSVKIKVFLLLCLLFLTQLSCSTTDPKLEPDLKLELKDVSCTEAWLQLTTNNIQLPATINLFKNNTVVQTFSLSTKDSLLYIDSLLPNQTYRFHTTIQSYNNASNELTVTTLDTTSHDFAWQTFVFGDPSTGYSSILYDVAIIDENNIWAVGEIYMYDSLGQTIRYNAMHWDGQSWELKRIFYYGACSAVTFPALKAIWAFDSNNIVITNGGSIGWFNGDSVNLDCEVNPLLTGAINKIWGSSRTDLFVVGNEGNIAHYHNGIWTKIESGTTTDLTDIYGTPDDKEIWSCGWSYNDGRVSILSIKENNIESIWDSQTNTTLNIYRGTLLNSLYANGNKEFVFVGGQVLRHSLFDKSKVKLEWIKTYNGSKVLELGNYGYRIKGSNKNNIFAAGDAAMIWHFNGSTWFKNSELYNLDDRLYGLAVAENTIIAVGKRYTPGTLGGSLLIIGRR